MKTVAPPTRSTAAQPAASMVLFADAYPDGAGGFLLKVRPPRSLVFRNDAKQLVQEIGCRDAAKILGVGAAQIHLMINTERAARRIIRWRYTSERKGKRMFEVASLLEYVKFTKTLED